MPPSFAISFATSANLLGVDTFPGWLPKSRARQTDLPISKPFMISSICPPKMVTDSSFEIF